jgi:quinol monooxygenase YgiN
MSKVTVVAKIVAKKESIEMVQSELRKLVAPTRKEAGCLEYRLHQDNSDPAVFIFYETWESGDFLIKHTKTEHYQNYVNAIAGLTEERVVNKLSVIE